MSRKSSIGLHRRSHCFLLIISIYFNELKLKNMDNFKRKNNFGGRNGGGFSGRNSGRPSMHKAVCDECGKDCEVPFKPTGEKPIFCNDCFRNKRNDSPRRSSGDDFRSRNFNDKKMHKAVCNKCGKDCEVPFKPTSGKPIYCSECFDKGNNRQDKSISPDQSNKQFDIINAKLDQIIKKLNPAKLKEVKEKKEPTKKVKISKPKKVVKAKAAASKEKKVASAKKAKAKPKPKVKKKK